MRDRSRKKRKQIKRDPAEIRTGKVICIVAVTDSPVAERCLRTFPSVCDEIYIQFDMFTGTQEFLQYLKRNTKSIFGGKLKKIEVGKEKWSIGKWHEDSLNMIKGVKGSLVFTPGHDETYQNKILVLDMKKLWMSGLKALMCPYVDMPTDDGRKIPFVYPAEPHMKVFKWQPGLTYVPYSGRGQIAQYAHPNVQMISNSGISHWCFYTKEMEEEKTEWIKQRYDFLHATGQDKKGKKK